MFEKITDFDGKIFLNLWGGFSCECFADGINTFVMFYINGKEVLSLSGNDANDILDFVLSEYYVNENSTIEDGFSNWLMEHYDNVIPTFDGVEPKFHNGEWVACKGLNTERIISNDDDKYEVELIDGSKGFPHIDYTDRYFHLWTIEDAKAGDILIYNDSIFIFEEIYNHYLIYYGIYEDNKFRDDKFYSFLDLNDIDINNILPATKKQRNTLMTAIADAGYSFDFEKKELKKIEQKSVAWSDVDEYMLNETIQHLKELIEIDKAKHLGCDVKYYQRDIDWLKSIKDRIGG